MIWFLQVSPILLYFFWLYRSFIVAEFVVYIIDIWICHRSLKIRVISLWRRLGRSLITGGVHHRVRSLNTYESWLEWEGTWVSFLDWIQPLWRKLIFQKLIFHDWGIWYEMNLTILRIKSGVEVLQVRHIQLLGRHWLPLGLCDGLVEPLLWSLFLHFRIIISHWCKGFLFPFNGHHALFFVKLFVWWKIFDFIFLPFALVLEPWLIGSVILMTSLHIVKFSKWIYILTHTSWCWIGFHFTLIFNP